MRAGDQYEHLHLTGWPFPSAAAPDFCTFIADRERLTADVGDLLSVLSRVDSSSIHLFWAWFGAGKTHTLYYLANQAEDLTKQSARNVLLPVYSEFPKAAKSFVDVYRSFMTAIDMDVLVDAFLEVNTSPEANRVQRELAMASPDLAAALHVMATGELQEQVLAMRWLRADALPVGLFRKAGISQKISSSDDATRILAAVIHLLRSAAISQGRTGCSVIWLIDEFQRITRAGTRVLNEVNAGLHSTFNASPLGLCLCLSFSGKPETTLPSWFSPELRDRIGTTKVMVLPPMQPEEALIFVRDVLEHFRPIEDIETDPFFPFSEETCRAIIGEISKRAELKPRSLMLAFKAVLEQADPRIAEGQISEISPSFAKSVLDESLTLGADEEEIA